MFRVLRFLTSRNRLDNLFCSLFLGVFNWMYCTRVFCMVYLFICWRFKAISQCYRAARIKHVSTFHLLQITITWPACGSVAIPCRNSANRLPHGESRFATNKWPSCTRRAQRKGFSLKLHSICLHKAEKNVCGELVIGSNGNTSTNRVATLHR